MILGDGNCFLFRAVVAHIIYGTEDNHATVRPILVTFLCNNRPVLAPQLHTKRKFLNNTLKRSPEKEPGELKWSSMLQQATINSPCTFSHHMHPQTNNYPWLLFEPEQCAHLCYGEHCTPPQTNSIITHIQLCHTAGDHFDCVLTLNNTLPTSPPQLDHTSSYINIR